MKYKIECDITGSEFDVNVTYGDNIIVTSICLADGETKTQDQLLSLIAAINYKVLEAIKYNTKE